MSSDMHDEDACSGGGTKATIWSSPDAQTAWRTYGKLHTRLGPYMSALAAHAHATGTPLVMSPWLVHPERRELATVDAAFYFGPSLYAVPVVTRGATIGDDDAAAGRARRLARRHALRRRHDRDAAGAAHRAAAAARRRRADPDARSDDRHARARDVADRDRPDRRRRRLRRRRRDLARDRPRDVHARRRRHARGATTTARRSRAPAAR